MQHNFLEQFQITPESYVSVVGSGGKSTLLKKIAYEASSSGWPTILTTTTHIHLPFFRKGEPFLIQEEKPDIETVSSSLQNKLLVLVEKKISDCKAKGFVPEVLKPLKNRFLLLVEADGSKKKPFKIPAAWEPVVPAESTHVIIVCSLSALDAPMTEEYIHRIELLKTTETSITPLLIAETLANPSHYLAKFPPSPLIFVYLAGCTDSKKYASALEISRHLKNLNFFYPVLW